MTTRMPALICASTGCDNTVERAGRRGRPAIYCSADCRPKRPARSGRTKHPADAGQPITLAHGAPPPLQAPGTVVVEVDNPDNSPDGRPARRVWTVRLRKDHQAVVIAEGLGWPSANALARQLGDLLGADRPGARDRLGTDQAAKAASTHGGAERL